MVSFSFSEVTVIIFIEVLVGIVALVSGFVFKNTYYVSKIHAFLINAKYSYSFTQLFVGFIVGALYFVAIGLVAILENVFNWK